MDEVLQRPWCYYCERDFDDLKILISHQKAKHFKCERCGRRLNTAGGTSSLFSCLFTQLIRTGLAVHMNQVHKESLSHVENALPNRQGLDQEIFGMEGIPDDIADTHKQRVIQQYYEDEANRRAATGNPPPGTVSGSKPKKARYESIEDTKKRLADFKIKKASGQLGGEVKPPAPAVQSPGQSNSPAPFVCISHHTSGKSLTSYSLKLDHHPSHSRPSQRHHRQALLQAHPSTNNHHSNLRSLNNSLASAVCLLKGSRGHLLPDFPVRQAWQVCRSDCRTSTIPVALPAQSTISFPVSRTDKPPRQTPRLHLQLLKGRRRRRAKIRTHGWCTQTTRSVQRRRWRDSGSTASSEEVPRSF